MYQSPTRRAGDNWLAGAHARQEPAEYHTGTYADHLRRHERECGTIATATSEQRREFAACLHSRAIDTRNLMSAIDHLTREPDKAPGPRGTRLEQLAQHERWDLCRTLHDLLQDGSYRPGDVRTIKIPKSSGIGTRPLEIADHEDLVIQRAITQVIQPYLDPLFDTWSYGYRPGRGRQHALTTAEILAYRENRYVWVAEDLRDAFTCVPHQRLLDILRRHGLSHSLVELIGQVIGRRRRGLPQGGCLSPLLLNVYLDRLLDRPWRRHHPDTPLIRVADDLLVLCSTTEDAGEAYDSLTTLLLPTGMTLKGSRQTAVRDLASRQTASWLGYQVSQDGQRIVARIGDRPWISLADKLAVAHHKSQSPLRAYRSVLGWVDQLGPCYSQVDIPEAYQRVLALGRRQAFDELPSLPELQVRWEAAHVRYTRLRRVLMLQMARGFAEGSASRHREPAVFGRGDGAPYQGALSPLLCVTLVTDGACDTVSRVGGWAYCLTNHCTGQRLVRSDSHPRSTNNRMELTAVIRGLEALEEPAEVTLISDSRYAIEGLTQHLVDWREAGWRRRGGGTLANVRLWQRLDDLVSRHRIRCEWVRGHAGHATNEVCDQLASNAVAGQLSGATTFGPASFAR